VSELLWGIDLGGTKIEGVILDPSRPEAAVHRLRRETQAPKGYDFILAQIEGVVRDLESVSGLVCPPRLGVGTPGAMEPSTGALKNSNTTCLNGRPLKGDLECRLTREIFMANDANCFALAEATLGAAVGDQVVMGLILGTGVGGGIVINGQVLQGAHGIAGEWGHNPLMGETHPCYCGRKGCVETAIAGPSLERFYQETAGARLRVPDIVRAAADGEAHALTTLDRLRWKFAEAIAAVINILDPDAIVIGGGVGNVEILYTEETRRVIERFLFHPTLSTRLLRPQLGDSAGVFGAAMLTNAR